jgi:hypothetical protein
VPNLDYDPRNPSDLLGRPIKPGDIVAWGTTYGRFVWDKAAGKIVEPLKLLWACRECRNQHGL